MIWLPPLLTVWLFAFSGVCGQRMTGLMDAMWANLVRLTLALIALAIVSMLFFGAHVNNAAFPWFLLSGTVGFGLGDIGLFLAYARIGSRITLLINLCLAPLFAALGEALWLGQTIAPREFLFMAIVITGVGIAITGRRPAGRAPRDYPAGILFAIIAGFGQGTGAVLSRFADGHASPDAVPALSQAFQRCLGGWVVVLFVTLALNPARRRAGRGIFHQLGSVNRVAPWMLGAVFFGPVVGVTCFQWSLAVVGNSALVQAIVSTTPIALIPLAYLFEKDIPTVRSIVGAIVAVSGVAAICLLHS